MASCEARPKAAGEAYFLYFERLSKAPTKQMALIIL